MNAEKLCSLSISEASDLIRRKDLAPTELLDAHLARIEEVNDKLNAFVTVTAEEAAVAARQAEAEIVNGGYRGPLHGIPLGIKDLFDTRGVETASGSVVMRGRVPEKDSAVVASLRDAGAVIVGKLQMDEFALGATSVNPHDGPARNPWNLERITGGSSGGSAAAVAAGLCMGAPGTDTGGSIRVPATFCGVVGLKPTLGLISRYGVLPVSWTLDTVGPITRTVRDAALFLNSVAGYDPRDLSTHCLPEQDFTAGLDDGIEHVRIGVLEEPSSTLIDAEVGEAVARAVRVLQEQGASVEEVTIPQMARRPGHIMGPEYAAVHRETYRSSAHLIGRHARNTIQNGLLTSAVHYLNAHRERTIYNREFAKVWERFDILVGPTAPETAATIQEASFSEEDGAPQPNVPTATVAVRAFNTTGGPGITVPCGFSSSGMPIGLHIGGRALDDARVLQVANAYQRATSWHALKPPV